MILFALNLTPTISSGTNPESADYVARWKKLYPNNRAPNKYARYWVECLISAARGMIRIAGLKGALRYVRAYRDHVFVVKLGGDVLSDRHLLDQAAGQLALLASLSIRLVVVHGGGPQASALSRRLGQEPVMIAGRRRKSLIPVLKQTGLINLGFAALFSVGLILSHGF